MSNFQFLESHWTDLAKLGDLSEKYVYSDPNTSIIKQGILSEVMVKYMLAYDGIRKLPEQCVFESNMMRIKINIRKANPEYVIRYLNSSIGLQELRKNAKQAVNQASINQQDVKMVKIALPSLEEQNEIVKIITSISNKDEAILNKAEAVIEEIDLMKKSILAKAFRGELGTNISKEKNSIEVLKKLIEEESK